MPERPCRASQFHDHSLIPRQLYQRLGQILEKLCECLVRPATGREVMSEDNSAREQSWVEELKNTSATSIKIDIRVYEREPFVLDSLAGARKEARMEVQIGRRDVQTLGSAGTYLPATSWSLPLRGHTASRNRIRSIAASASCGARVSRV